MVRNAAETHWGRRSVLAGLGATVASTQAFSMSSGGVHLTLAEHARDLTKHASHASLSLLVPKGSVSTLSPAITDFQELTGAEISLHEANFREVGTTLLLEMMLGNANFDLALPPTYEIPDLVAAEAIRPLNVFNDATAISASVDGAIYREGDSFDGRDFGYQTDGDVYLMFLNEDILSDTRLNLGFEEKHGMVFSAPDSWEQFDLQAKFVNRLTGKPGAVLHRGLGQVEWEFWLRLHAKGIWPLSIDFEPQIAAPEGIAALEEMIDLKPHIAASTNGRHGFRDNWQVFAQKGAFATLGWGGTRKVFNRNESLRQTPLAYTQIPGGLSADQPDHLPYFNWGWSYVIPSSAPSPELAHLLALFFVSPEPSARAVASKAGYFDPFHETHFKDPRIRELYGKDLLSVHQSSLRGAIPDFYVANRAAYFEALGGWLTLALDGIVSPKQALEGAAQSWRKMTRTTEQQKQALRWRQLRAKYPRTVATRLRDI